MASSYAKLDQALKDLIEAYTELDEVIEKKYGEDEDAFSHAIIEALETSIESALEEHDTSTNTFATILSSLTEALEQLDPSAFEDEDADYEMEEADDEDAEYDIDADDLDDYDEDEDDEDEDK